MFAGARDRTINSTHDGNDARKRASAYAARGRPVDVSSLQLAVFLQARRQAARRGQAPPVQALLVSLLRPGVQVERVAPRPRATGLSRARPTMAALFLITAIRIRLYCLSVDRSECIATY